MTKEMHARGGEAGLLWLARELAVDVVMFGVFLVMERRHVASSFFREVDTLLVMYRR